LYEILLTLRAENTQLGVGLTPAEESGLKDSLDRNENTVHLAIEIVSAKDAAINLRLLSTSQVDSTASIERLRRV
jgi:hypothetical protein